MASIRRRGKGYQVQVRRVGSKPASRTFTLKADAERWARQAEIDTENGYEGNHMPLSVRLHSLLERYAKHHAPHLKSRKQTLSLIRLMIDRLGHLPVKHIDNPVLAQYRDARLGVVSSQTVRKELDIVRRVIRLSPAPALRGFGRLSKAQKCPPLCLLRGGSRLLVLRGGCFRT